MDTSLSSQALLQKQVRLLGEILGETLKAQVGEALYEKIEHIRQLSKKAEQYPSHHNITELNQILEGLTPTEIVSVVRAFSHFLNLANIAENVHRIRRTQWFQHIYPTLPQSGSLKATLHTLSTSKINPKIVEQAVADLHIDLVLTAHPTEVMRRTLMQKFDRIARLLQLRTDPAVDSQEKAHTEQLLYKEMTAIWQTDEIRRKRPTPIDEAKWGFAIVENCLWQALPQYMRELDADLRQYIKKPLPLTAAPLRFSSWMGGDRDGNPNVTAEITEKICIMARWTAADLYLREINSLSAELSMRSSNAALSLLAKNDPEPYRAVLRLLKEKLWYTKNQYEANLASNQLLPTDILQHENELLDPLLLCYDSLQENNAACIANAELLDLIRRVKCFGLTLLPLDIRQEASKHTQLLDEITQYLGIGSYQTWDELRRQQFLIQELQNHRPLISKEIILSPESLEVWNTFLMIARQLPASLGSYIISMAKNPSDILACCLLQKEAGNTHLPVVPLFETLADLSFAGTCLEQLFMIPWYIQHIQGQQQIMIGYSDSGKDAGILTAAWAQYQAQEKLTAVAKRYAIDLTLFHGRGGSIGRGGAPTHLAILSQPPGSVMGRLRVTEQGEVIRNKFGLPERACRTMELYTSATLQAMLLPSPTPKKNWRTLMETLAHDAHNTYLDCVKDPHFIAYFEQVTPLKELGTLAMGSRPMRRNTNISLESLRAIPWVFAWTQNRLLLPAWLGVGEALEKAIAAGQLPLLKEMAREWPFFRSFLSMIEMVLTKSSPAITQLYENRLVEPTLHAFGENIRKKWWVTEHTLKQVLAEETLLASNPLLFHTIHLRAAYLYPLHILQAELLYRVRKDQTALDALLVTISGIAAGMQNTG